MRGWLPASVRGISVHQTTKAKLGFPTFLPWRAQQAEKAAKKKSYIVGYSVVLEDHQNYGIIAVPSILLLF
jgi:hypothetical protein